MKFDGIARVRFFYYDRILKRCHHLQRAIFDYSSYLYFIAVVDFLFIFNHSFYLKY
jgi:hypothetical protein